MKILMLTPYLPYPPSSGGQIRSYSLIKHLSQKHEITLFSLIKNREEEEYAKELRKYCREVLVFRRPEKPWTLDNILRTGFSLYPFLVVRNMSTAEKKIVAEKIKKEKFDLIHAETFYVMPHIPRTKVPILLVDQTIEFQVYQHYADTTKRWFLKPFLYLDVAKLRFWETRFWRQANRVVAVSESDRKKMLSLAPGIKVDVIPNGAGEDLMSVYEERKPDFRKPIVFFQSNFLWIQNIEGAETLIKEVFPRIKEENPNIICRITGQKSKEKLGHLINKENDFIEIVEVESGDIGAVKEIYQKGAVFVAPLWGGGGTRLKILGAMAAGVPVVTTTIGMEGIEAKDGQEVLIRDTAQGMAEAVKKLLTQKNFYEKIVINARKLVEKKYHWQEISKKLDKIYQEVAYGKN